MRSRYRIFLFAILSSFSIAFLTNTPPVSAQTPSPTPTTTCGAEVSAVGWILCPVADMVTKANDVIWKLCEALLVLDPLGQNDGHGADTPVYVAWTSIRDVANVVFVIFFLMIIFSQLTSVGISNYGIKKMLPRLVVCAILVNVSFIVMQLAVDISNIAGKGMYDFLAALAPTADLTKFNWGSLVNMILLSAGTGVALWTLGVFLSPALAFWILVPIALAGLMALLVAVLTLIFRTAIIPILTIFAPLAFVAYMLPNTNVWYKRWRDLLISMLMMYPLAAVVFGGARFSAIIIYLSNPNNVFNNIIGLVIMFLPLFSLPFLTRMGGPILSKVSGALNGLSQKIQKPVNEYAKSQEDLNRARHLDQDSRGGLRGGLHGMYKQMHYSKRNRETETKTRMESHGSRWLSEDARAAELMVAASNVGKQSTVDKNDIAHAADISEQGMALNERIGVQGLQGSIDTQSTTNRVAATEQAQKLEQILGEEKMQTNIHRNKVDTRLEQDTPAALYMEAKASEKELQAAKAENNQVVAEASSATGAAALGGLVPNQTLQSMQNSQRVIDTANMATNSANRIQQGEFQQAIVDNPQLAADVGGIDIEHGATRATAIAAAGIERTRNENVAAIRSKLKQDGLDQMKKGKNGMYIYDDKSLLGLAVTAQDVETKIAAMQEYAAVANKADMLELLDVAQINKPDSNDSPEVKENKKLLQQAIGQELVKNKPETATGKVLGDLGSGRYSSTIDDAAITAIEERKYSAATVANMHYGELEEWKKVINEYMEAGEAGVPIPENHAEILRDMRNKIDTAFDDPRINHNINDKQRAEMEQIKAMIVKKYGPTPKPKRP